MAKTKVESVKSTERDKKVAEKKGKKTDIKNDLDAMFKTKASKAIKKKEKKQDKPVK